MFLSANVFRVALKEVAKALRHDCPDSRRSLVTGYKLAGLVSGSNLTPGFGGTLLKTNCSDLWARIPSSRLGEDVVCWNAFGFRNFHLFRGSKRPIYMKLFWPGPHLDLTAKDKGNAYLQGYLFLSSQYQSVRPLLKVSSDHVELWCQPFSIYNFS